MASTAPKIDNGPADGLDYVHLNKVEENIRMLQGGDATLPLSTAAATAHALVKRDAAGRAKVVAPAAEDDIALKSNVTAEATARSNADVTLTNAVAIRMPLAKLAAGVGRIALATSSGLGLLVFPESGTWLYWSQSLTTLGIATGESVGSLPANTPFLVWRMA